MCEVVSRIQTLYIPATVGILVVVVVVAITVVVAAIGAEVVVVVAVVAEVVVVVDVIALGFNSSVLHSVVLNISLGGLMALFDTDAICTSIMVLVTSGNGILLAEVFPTTMTSVLPSSG